MRGGKLDAEKKKKKKKGQRDCQCAGGGSGYALTRLPTVVPLLICGPAPVEKIKKMDSTHTHRHTHTFIVMIWNFIRHRSWCEYPVWCASRVDCPFVRGGGDMITGPTSYTICWYIAQGSCFLILHVDLYFFFFFFHLSDVIRMTLTLALPVFLMGAFNLFPCDFCGPLVVARAAPPSMD